MALNIKDDRVHQQVKEIAAVTGETQAEVVRTAVEERLQRIRRPDRRQRLLRISQEAAARIPPDTDLSGDQLYDDHGLPA